MRKTLPYFEMFDMIGLNKNTQLSFLEGFGVFSKYLCTRSVLLDYILHSIPKVV